MALTLPTTLPAAYALLPGATAPTSDVDTGGYDFTVGGFGFRLATDTNFPYSHVTEPITVHRFDTEAEPGEQSLSPLPWIKSQSSFHGGAGLANLEQGLTAFQYEQEKIDHVRFDNCQGVDVWTPGTVTRLPDCHFYAYGFSASVIATATVSGIDYAILGGSGGLYQAAWLSGPDASPTITAVDLTGSNFGGASNCNIKSLCTDGYNYYGVLQMTSAGFVASVLTYIIKGQINSSAQPVALYEVPNSSTGVTRHNLCTNPSFETDTVGWAGAGSPAPTLARDLSQHFVGVASLLVTSTGASTFLENVTFNVPTVAGTTYTFSAYVYSPTGNPLPTAFALSGFGSAAPAHDSWQRVSCTFKATGATSNVGLIGNFTAAGQLFYVDAVLIEVGSVVGSYFDGSTAAAGGYTFTWDGTVNDSASTGVASALVSQVPSVVGWQKARLVSGIGASFYELDSNAAAHSALPSARYTHPVANWTWTAITESPSGILAAGATGGASAILLFTLDTSGGTPFLSGGASVAELPPGETINAMRSYLASFIGIGTSRGVRVGTFDTYTGNLKLGPLTVSTTNPVLAVAGRDRFLYAGYTNQQADGKTGLLRVDLTLPVDVAGRLAFAPDLRPPSTAPTGLGAVTCIGILPTANRIIFITPEGIHVEGNGPGSDGSAWLRTSRIRYDTAEMKLFKLGRVHGALDKGDISVIGVAPFGTSSNLGTFRTLPNNDDPGEFRLPNGLNEWIQLEFHLIGSASALWSYQAKALPAPKPQHVISLTAACFITEFDRSGLETSDPQDPRTRLQNVKDLETAGNEVRLVEFTNNGSVATLVKIDQVQFQSFKRPSFDDDFGGYITFKLRPTEA